MVSNNLSRLYCVWLQRGLIQQANKVLAAQFDERFRAVEAETRHYFDRMHKIIEQRAKSILDKLVNTCHPPILHCRDVTHSVKGATFRVLYCLCLPP